MQETNKIDSDGHSEAFVELVVSSQRRLYAYILALLPNVDLAHDILQQTNMAIWSEADSFKEGTNFVAWSYRIAYFRVLEYRKKHRRDRLQFDSELVERLANESEKYTTSEKEQFEAMQECLNQLPERHQDLLWRRYVQGEMIGAIAESIHQSATTISSRLCRIRAKLWVCIQNRLLPEARS